MAEHLSITTPRSWFELELRPQRRDVAIKDLVNERVREIPALRDHRADVIRMLRRYARWAWNVGARYSAAFATPAEDTVITGSLMITDLPYPPDAGDDPLGAVAEHLSRASAGPGDETWSSVEIAEIEGLGRCPRSFGVEDVDLPKGAGTVRVVTMQTFVPLRAGRLLLVACSSPDLDLAADLLELFAAVTATLRVRADEAAPAAAR
ncbi:hypothetical protein QT381_06585 [Galbitalea sp. SE-J8]|uniref:hypothetical protein n=1 Tax=Galbitalea sp. SE-J8 TaxID=3054952 RepID=UPI00259CB78C|nr:hypothetical protein [Galbitalea sp. SE-J8]MDM4762670.1 hypothetical protein [Galbitalea sp. SE-J8]